MKGDWCRCPLVLWSAILLAIRMSEISHLDFKLKKAHVQFGRSKLYKRV